MKSLALTYTSKFQEIPAWIDMGDAGHCNHLLSSVLIPIMASELLLAQLFQLAVNLWTMAALEHSSPALLEGMGCTGLRSHQITSFSVSQNFSSKPLVSWQRMW